MLVLSAAAPAVPPAAGDLALPLHADASLQDYVVKADVYDRRCAKTWRAGERFRMYFGSKVRRGGGQSWLTACCVWHRWHPQRLCALLGEWSSAGGSGPGAPA
jgi:hypothetical protein